MRLGISTHLLKELRTADALSFIARTGFRAAEIWFADMVNNGEPPEAITPTARKHRLHLSLHGQAIQIDPSNPAVMEKSLERIFQAIRTAGQIGAGPVVIHPARRWPQAYDPKTYWRHLETALGRINARARARNMVVALEVMDGRKPAEVIIGPQDIKRVMAFGLSNVRICLDMAHIQTVMPPVDFLERIDPSWLHHVHLSDRSAAQRHLPLGMGTLPVRDVLERLSRIYKGLVIIEGRVRGQGKSVVQANYRYLHRHGWVPEVNNHGGVNR